MQFWAVRTIVVCAAAVILTGAATAARESGRATWTNTDEAAFREMIEGASGRVEAWSQAPALVILGTVMDFTGSDMKAGYVATGDAMSAADVAQLQADLTEALGILTGGRTTAFASVAIEPVAEGRKVRMFRPDTVVVGRFRGVHERAGTLGFGGRTTRAGAITSGAVVLDSDFDRKSARRHVLRMHELGHALGYNHVQSRPSIMNPRVGADLTDFDRIAIAVANELQPVLSARLQR